MGAVINYTEKKTTINFGARLYDVYFNQIDLRHVTELTRKFINWAPQVSYQYRISQLASFKFEYVGNTQQPTIDQIQPLKTNTDPLNIVVGNPNLTPSFNNNFSLKYNSYNVKWKQSISLSGVYGFVSNAIVNSVFTDYLTGKSTYTSINLANRYPVNYNVSINLSRKVKPLDFTASFNTYVYGNIIYGFSKGALSRSDANNYVFQFGASKGVVEKYDFYINAGPGYTVSRSSLQATNNNGSTFNADGGLNIYFPWRIQFSSDTRYEYAAPTESFGEPFHFTIVNASISRKFFNQQDFKLMLSVNDLLNQNAGFRRVTYSNTIEQINESTIKRYFKFSVTWDFNHAIGNTKK